MMMYKPKPEQFIFDVSDSCTEINDALKENINKPTALKGMIYKGINSTMFEWISSAWKAMKIILYYVEGIDASEANINSPTKIFAEFERRGYITAEERNTLLRLYNNRNTGSHGYNAPVSVEEQLEDVKDNQAFITEITNKIENIYAENKYLFIQ